MQATDPSRSETAPHEQDRKQQALAQPDPSRLQHPDARVLKSAELFMLCTKDGSPTATTPTATPSPEKYCTSCDAASSRGSAKSRRARCTTAPWMSLDWMERWGDRDGDGCFDYGSEDGGGHAFLINRGWKDSGDAIVNADGSLAQPPIALCEVQGYAYDAWQRAAVLLRALGNGKRAADVEERAARMRERFERDFWSDRLGCYVLVRQRGGRPAEVVSSNAGQVLWSGIASAERAGRVVARLTEEDMYSGWGVRTLSASARRYNPVSYHRGSVWPHDNSLMCVASAPVRARAAGAGSAGARRWPAQRAVR